MKKFALITLIVLSTVKAEYSVFTPHGPKKMEDYVQDGLSRLSGENNYNSINPEERRTLLNNTIMRVYRKCGNGCSYNCANAQIQEELADFVCQRIYRQCVNQGFSYSKAEEIRKHIRASIQNKINNNQSTQWKYGLANGIFNNYLGENSTYEIQRAREKLENKKTQKEIKTQDEIRAGFIGFVLGALAGIFATHEDTQHQESTQKQYPPVPVYQPTPSAPAEDAVPLCPKTFYVEETCFCDEDFGPGQHERIFPSCGHSICRACVNKWVMVHKNCPHCRKDLKDELFNIQRAADNAAYCCACGGHENNMIKMPQCAHKVCRNCYAGWQKTGSSNCCPKCNIPQSYPGIYSAAGA